MEKKKDKAIQLKGSMTTECEGGGEGESVVKDNKDSKSLRRIQKRHTILTLGPQLVEITSKRASQKWSFTRVTRQLRCERTIEVREGSKPTYQMANSSQARVDT